MILEFAPICIYLVISPLVSLISLGVPFPFASNSSTYPEKLSAYVLSNLLVLVFFLMPMYYCLSFFFDSFDCLYLKESLAFFLLERAIISGLYRIGFSDGLFFFIIRISLKALSGEAVCWMDASSSGANEGWTSVLGSSSGGSSEASVNQTHPNSDVLSNPNRAGPSTPPENDFNLVDQPAPLIPFLQEEGERGDLLRRLQKLVAEQLQHYCERDLPRWRHSPDTTHFLEAAAFIVEKDLEVENETIQEISNWILRLERDPNLMKDIYHPFKGKRVW